MTDLVAGENQTCGLLENQNVLCWDNFIRMNDEITVNSVYLELAFEESQHICELSAENNLLCWNQRE